jgi:Sulfotransferase family
VGDDWRRIERLLRQPAFVLSSIRSGSTLMRCLLNSHSMIYSPHELHLRYLRVGIQSEYARLSLDVLRLGRADLRYLLWDRYLHALLVSSGKSILVEKSPSNLYVFRDLLNCWPDARFVFLRRHPVSIVKSIADAGDGRDESQATDLVVRVVGLMEDALQTVPDSAVIRYEDLTWDPEAVCRRLCEFLQVPYESSMLAYGRFDHGPFVYGIGDWGDRILSGRVHRARTPLGPRRTSGPLEEACRRWGYSNAYPEDPGIGSQ